MEAFSVFLTEIYQEAVTQNPGRVFRVTPIMFERRGIEDQLDILASEFAIAAEWISRLTGYNRARNCLAHRLGIVGARDVTHGSELVIRWLNATAAAVPGSPSEVVGIEGPMSELLQARHVEGTSAASIRIEDQEKRVSIGKSIKFLPNEVLGICQTFQLAVGAFSGVTLQQSQP